MAQRGGSVVTYVRYGDHVAEPIVEEGHADVERCVDFQKLTFGLCKADLFYFREVINPFLFSRGSISGS